MSTIQTGTSARTPYQKQLFGFTPIYTTRLVRETTFIFPDRKQMCAAEDVAGVLHEYYQDKDREEFFVVLLDTANTIIGLSKISTGGLASSIVEPRQVFKAAILSNAAAIILAHNHPSGNPEPSSDDIRITRQLLEAGKIMGIPVHDHLIIHDQGFTSFAERSLLNG